MAIPGISKIETLATKYSKAQLANMAQSGLIAPTEAVMAGMMIDRIMAENMKQPTTTVAQDVLAPPPPQQQAMPQGDQPQEPQMGMPPEAAPEAPTQMAASGGLTSLPAGDVGNYAGGGMVSFAKGGTPYEIFTPQMKNVAVPGIPTVEEEQKRQMGMEQQFGIDPEFYKKRAGEVAGEREALGKEKSTAWMDALIMGGLGAAAGKSPYALTNIAEGGIKGFETYQGQMKDIRERDKALRESDQKIKEAEYLRSIGKMDTADKRITDAQKLAREAENINVNMANEVSKVVAAAKTQAGETGYKEAQATGRTNITAGTQMAIAKLPPDQLRMVQALNAEDVAKAKKENKPPPTMVETYQKMHPAYGGGTQPGKSWQEYSKDWNRMDFMEKRDFIAKNPGINTPEKYATFMAGQQQTGTTGGAGGASRELSAQDTQALNWANANPNDPRSAEIKTRLGR